MSLAAGSARTGSHALALAKNLAPVAALLGISTFINYIDRGSLSLAVPMLKVELQLDPWHMGILLSSFFWTYTSFQIVSGWLVDRFNVNWVLAGGFFIWTLATATTGFVHGFQMLLVMRLILGAGESVAFPSYSKILAKHFPESRRGRANSFISAGIAGGPAFGIFFGAMLIGRYGWRPFFVALGLMSLLWLPPWKVWMPKGPGLDISASAQTPGLLEILRQRSAWGTFVGLFAFNYLSYFLLTWLPSFLVNERNFSMQKMGTIGGIAYLLLATSALICGWVSDLWIASGATPTRVRKTFTTTGLAISSCSCLAVVAFASDSRLAVLFLFVTCAGAGLCTANLWAITQTIAGPLAAGKWSGLQNCFGNFAGIIAPALTGYVVQRTGHFFWAFAATAFVLLAGALSWAFVVGRVEPIHWKGKEFVAAPQVTAN